MGRPRQVASWGVGLELLTGQLLRNLDNVLGRAATRLAGFAGRASVLFSLPLGFLVRQMSDMATEVDLRAREATALLAATFGEDLFTPEAQRTLEQNYQEIIDRSLKLSIQLGETASDIVNAVFFAIGTGFPTLADAFKIVEQATMAAVAGSTDTQTALNTLISTLNAYGYSADQAKYVSDVLFQTVNVGKVTFSELAQSLGDILGIAPQFGVSLEEIGAIIATATRHGQTAGLAMVGLRQILIDLLAPKPKGAKIFAEIFDTTEESVGNVIRQMIELEGLFPILGKVARAAIDPITGKFDPQKGRDMTRRVQGYIRILPLFVELTKEEADAIAVMNERLAAGEDPVKVTEEVWSDLSDAFERNTGDISDLTEIYNQMQIAQQGVGATAAAMSEHMKSLDRRAKIATASFDALKIVIGLELKSLLLPVIETLGRLVKTLVDMPPAAKRAVTIFLILATAIPVALFALSLFIGMVGQLIAIMGALLSFALNPVVLALGLLAYWGVKAKLATEEFTDSMKRAKTPLQRLVEVFLAIVDVTADALQAVADFVSGFLRLVAQAVVAIANFFGANIQLPEIRRREVTTVEEETEAEIVEGRIARPSERIRGRGIKDGEAYAEGVAEGVSRASILDELLGDVVEEDEATSYFSRIGRAAIRSLLRGMSAIDFSIFTDAISLVEAEVRALKLEGEEAALALQNAQFALAQAISGDLSAWEALRSIIGDSVSLIQEYVAARRAEEAAEENLRAVERARRLEIARLDAKIAAIREKIRQFELDTAEIPERYTRHRRRQLEEELAAAQKEKDARQEQLDAQVEAAQAQAEAAREHASRLAELIRLEQQLLAATEDTGDAGEELVKSLQELIDEAQLGDIAGLENISKAFDGLGEKLNTLDYFMRGLLGEELTSTALKDLTEDERLAYEQGQRLRESLTEIKDALGEIVSSAQDLAGTFGDVWTQTPDWFKEAVKYGLIIGIGWRVVKPLLPIVTGFAGVMAKIGAKLIAGGKWAIEWGIFLASYYGPEVVAGLKGALTRVFSALGVTLTGGIWTVAISVVLAWAGGKIWEDISGEVERVESEASSKFREVASEAESSWSAVDDIVASTLAAIEASAEEFDAMVDAQKGYNDVFSDSLFDKGEALKLVQDIHQAILDSSSSYDEYKAAVDTINEKLIEELGWRGKNLESLQQLSDLEQRTTPELARLGPEDVLLEPLSPEVWEEFLSFDPSTVPTGFQMMFDEIYGLVPTALSNAKELGAALTDPILDEVQDMSDELVGESIIPDMITAAIDEFRRLGTDGSRELNSFLRFVGQWGATLETYWYAFWQRVSINTVSIVGGMMAQVTLLISSAITSIVSTFNTLLETIRSIASLLVFDSVVPEMVDAMLVEFERMRMAGEDSFDRMFSDLTAKTTSGANLLTQAMQSIQNLPTLEAAVSVVGIGEQEPMGATFYITHQWDAAITDKDRAEIGELVKDKTYESIVLAYGRRVRGG